MSPRRRSPKRWPKQLQIPFINLKYYNIKPEITQKLPETQARRFRAILLEDNPKAFKVGMADPTDLNAYDEIARILKREIEIAVVTESQLLATIDRVYRRTGEITGLAQELQAEMGDAVIDFGVLAATPGLEEAPVVKLLQSVFEDATQVRASDIHIEPQEKKLLIRFRIDGVLHLQTEADTKIASALVLRLKLMSGSTFRKSACRRMGASTSRSAPTWSTCGSRPCRRSTANRW